MLIDCIELFSISIKSAFVNILISVSIVYSFVLYRKFFGKEDIKEEELQKTNNEINIKYLKPIRHKMFVKVLLSFFFWLFLILFINNAWFSIILLPLILGLCLYITKNRWLNLFDKYNKYDRIFILKHSVYIVLFAVLSTIVVYLLLSCNYIYKYVENTDYSKFINDWNNSITLLQSHFLAKHISIIFFTLNGIILPLLFGYIYLIIHEREIIKRINNLQIQYKARVLDYEEEFKTIERKIDSTTIAESSD